MAFLNIIQNVFAVWSKALEEQGIKAYMEQPKKKIEFPCASLLPLPSGEAGYDLDNNPSGIDLSLQVDLFAQAPLSKLYEMNAISHEVLCSFGFRLTAQATPEMGSYKRLISRYSRIIGYGEPISTED